MDPEHFTTQEAIDALDLIRRSVADYGTVCRLMRKVRKAGKPVDEAKARETLTAVLKDLMEACTFLSQGDDFDRARVCQDVAAAIVEG